MALRQFVTALPSYLRRGYQSTSVALAEVTQRNRATRDRPTPSNEDTDSVLYQHYFTDFTGTGLNEERAQRASLLSDNAKDTIFYLHTDRPKEWTIEKLAERYKVRQQRIMAIVHLKELEKKRKDSGVPLHEDLHAMMTDNFGRTYEDGGGEKHVKLVDDYRTEPNYNLALGADAEVVSSSKSIDPIKLAAQFATEDEEKMMVGEFKDRLAFNSGKTAKSIDRRHRHHKGGVSKRPDSGWSFLVTPSGKDAGRPFVAQSDGVQRPPNADEQVLIQRRTAKPRARLV